MLNEAFWHRLLPVITILVFVSVWYSLSTMSTPASINWQFMARKPKIVLFGDSLTERGFNPDGGWAGALANYYSRKADVINRGFGGYNTRWGLHMAPSTFNDLSSDLPLLTTIFFGANDAALPGKMGDLQHIPIEEYRKNLRQIVQFFKGQGVQNIVLLTPPPVYEPGRLIHQKQIAERDNRSDANTSDPDRTNEAAGQYAKATVAVGAEVDVPVVDLWEAMQRDPDWHTKFLIEDGLHFSGQGNMFVFDQLRDLIEKDLPQIRPDALPRHMPMWFQVDATDPAATFKDVPEIA